MRVIVWTLKFVLFFVMLMLALAWMAFFGIVGTAFMASVFFTPVGLACYGVAVMPLFAALGWMGWRKPAGQVTVNVTNNN